MIQNAWLRGAAWVCVVGGAVGAPGVLLADDWTNSGGNAGRNGRTREVGPDAADPLWSGGRSSIIAWQPVIAGSRVFTVRQTGFPPEPNSDKSPVVAMDLDTGAELWFRNIPFNTGDWTTWIAGVSNGQVYAGRSGNGASVAAKLYALDAASGGTVWMSQDLIDAGAYDGVVFANNGDPIVASFRKIWRIRATDGTTAWSANRVGSVSGNCGGAVFGNAVYVADAVVGGNAIKKYNLTTGGFQYQSPVMAGFTIQTTPMVGPDGTIYLQRVQNNAGVDFFYAIADNGAAMSIKWSVPAGYCTSSEFTVGPDGSVYMWAPGSVIKRLNPATGGTVNTSVVIPSDFAAPRMASDNFGRLFISNGAFSNGHFYSFNDDLSPRWDTAVANINIGAPSIGRRGTLVICGVGTDIRAYRTARCAADYNGDGFVDPLDYNGFINDFEAGDMMADFNGDGFLDPLDYNAFINAFEAGC